jgi:hypothetical protein
MCQASARLGANRQLAVRNCVGDVDACVGVQLLGDARPLGLTRVNCKDKSPRTQGEPLEPEREDDRLEVIGRCARVDGSGSLAHVVPLKSRDEPVLKCPKESAGTGTTAAELVLRSVGFLSAIGVSTHTWLMSGSPVAI